MCHSSPFGECDELRISSAAGHTRSCAIDDSRPDVEVLTRSAIRVGVPVVTLLCAQIGIVRGQRDGSHKLEGRCQPQSPQCFGRL
jgi:hypothetical protein